MAKKKPPVRDPNIPVLSFQCGDARHEILIAGPKDFIDVKFKSHGCWSPNSIIHRDHSPSGLHEMELNLYDFNFWGWIGRLVCDGTIKRDDFKLLTKSDSQRYNLAHGLDVPDHLAEPAPIE